MREIKRFLVEVPYTVTQHEVAHLTVEAESEETAKCEAMAIVRAGLVQPIIHDARIVIAMPLEPSDG